MNVTDKMLKSYYIIILSFKIINTWGRIKCIDLKLAKHLYVVNNFKNLELNENF